MTAEPEKTHHPFFGQDYICIELLGGPWDGIQLTSPSQALGLDVPIDSGVPMQHGVLHYARTSRKTPNGDIVFSCLPE